jgi:hypothetical protein
MTELQHLPWPAQSPHLNVNERPIPTSVKQLQVVLEEECYTVPVTDSSKPWAESIAALL